MLAFRYGVIIFLCIFLLGVRGPKKLAVDIKEEISRYIKNNLQIELKKSDLNNAMSSNIKFLGFDVKVPRFKETEVLKPQENIEERRLKIIGITYSTKIYEKK